LRDWARQRENLSVAMPIETLLGHTAALRTALMMWRNPVSPATIGYFNRLLEQAQAVRTASPLIRAIPKQGPGASRHELLLWLSQLDSTLRPW
jgi:hypothetical protein